MKLGAMCVLLALLSGCAELRVMYKPLAHAPPPPTGVAVQVRVEDARPPSRGGGARVGQLRPSSIGISYDIEDVDARVVLRTVDEATRDALGRAGVALSDRPGRVLTATVREFWMGHLGYRSAVQVEYTLWNTEGARLWVASLQGSAVGYDIERSWPSMTEELFQRALWDVSTQAATAFRSPGFLSAARAAAE